MYQKHSPSRIPVAPCNSPVYQYTILPPITNDQCPPIGSYLPPLIDNFNNNDTVYPNSSPYHNETLTPSLVHTPNEVLSIYQLKDNPTLFKHNPTKLDLLVACSELRSYSSQSPPGLSFESNKNSFKDNEYIKQNLFYKSLIDKLETINEVNYSNHRNIAPYFSTETQSIYNGIQTPNQYSYDKSGNITPLPLLDGSGRILHFTKDNENRTYKCLEAECGKIFHSVFNLKSHATTHSEMRAFSCQQCGNAFRRKQDLNRHLLIHTKVKPFACPNCNRRFSRKDAQRRHSSRKKCISNTNTIEISRNSSPSHLISN